MSSFCWFDDDGYGFTYLDDLPELPPSPEYPVPIFTKEDVPEDQCEEKRTQTRAKRIFKPFFTGYVDQLTVEQLNNLMKKIDDKKWEEILK